MTCGCLTRGRGRPPSARTTITALKAFACVFNKIRHFHRDHSDIEVYERPSPPFDVNSSAADVTGRPTREKPCATIWRNEAIAPRSYGAWRTYLVLPVEIQKRVNLALPQLELAHHADKYRVGMNRDNLRNLAIETRQRAGERRRSGH